MTSFSDQRILITGASSGIGEDLALFLAEQKAHLAIVARRREKLDILKRRLLDLGSPDVRVYEADVQDSLRMQTVCDDLLSHWPHLDTVIANAGVGALNPGYAFDMELDRKVMSINYFGMINTLMPFVPSMMKRRQGHLVGVSSLAAFRGLPQGSSYSAAKRAQAIFLESMRVDLRPHGIDVTCIHPGFVESEMTAHDEFPMPFKVKTRDSSRLIARAITQRRSVYLYPWPMRYLTMLNRILPNWLYDRLVPVLAGASRRQVHATLFGK